jgi:parallel beta-helix repeat protein
MFYPPYLFREAIMNNTNYKIKEFIGFAGKNKNNIIMIMIFLMLNIFFIFWSVPAAAADFIKLYNPANSNFSIKLSDKTYTKINVNEILRKPSKVNVYSLAELKKALDMLSNKKGEHVIILRKNIANKKFHYKQKHHRAAHIYIIGLLADNSPAFFFNSVVWENIANITFSHIKLNKANARKNQYIWQIRNSRNIRLTNVMFYGANKGIAGTPYNPRGIRISNSTNILIDRSLFQDLFHAVEFTYLTNFFAIANKGNRLASDMFSGGGTQNALFDSNLSFTKLPTEGVHSDMIQLYTQKMTIANHNITIRNNVSIPGNSPIKDSRLRGWQCFFTRDENKAFYFSNIRIHNNICVSNQHHGVTLSRGYNNIISNNLILEIGRTRNPNITAGIRVNDNSNTKVLGNFSKSLFTKSNKNTRKQGNRILDNLQLGYDYVKNVIKQKRTVAPSRHLIEQINNAGVLQEIKMHLNKHLTSPIDSLDFNKLGVVPS